MVSAVFHSPLESAQAPTASVERSATHSIAANVHEACAKAVKDHKNTVAALSATPRRDFSALWLRVLPPLLGLGLLALVWELVSMATKASIPSPKETLQNSPSGEREASPV